ncbi:hypothetical protein, partial [Salmonella sp. s54395]|uniref:hypothetical protein n=1 Tax=Salmonella sp. s54395 TaxID=3159664 RepID=UPI00397F16C0
HCEVVVCDASDNSSECRHGCEQSRHRRSVDGPYTKATRIVQGPLLLASEGGEQLEMLRMQTGKDAMKTASGLFTSVLSAVSLVMLLGLFVLGVVLVKVMRKQNHQEYRPLPNPIGARVT